MPLFSNLQQECFVCLRSLIWSFNGNRLPPVWIKRLLDIAVMLDMAGEPIEYTIEEQAIVKEREIEFLRILKEKDPIWKHM